MKTTLTFTAEELRDLSDALYEAKKIYEHAASMLHYSLTTKQRTREADRRWRLHELRTKINVAQK